MMRNSGQSSARGSERNPGAFSKPQGGLVDDVQKPDVRKLTDRAFADQAPSDQAPSDQVPSVRASGARGAVDQVRSARTATGATGANRNSLYDEVTAKIIAQLEAGRLPWIQPWGVPASDGTPTRGGTPAGAVGSPGPALPRNALTGRPYSGVNILILWSAFWAHATPHAGAQGFASQGWLTFRQAMAAGGCVRKGERGTSIVYADRFVPEAEKARVLETGGEAKAIAFLKRFTVFNVAQCDGLPETLAPDPVPLAPREIVPVAEALIAASGVDVRIGGTKAFYAPGEDFVAVPPQHCFFDPINFYRTCLHEITHASGHVSRLDRNLINSFGSKDYAREELVAEMGSAFLCATLGIVPTVRHADYIGSWLEVLREDGRAIFRAASAASKAADWLLARHADAAASQPLPVLPDTSRHPALPPP
jgi:antirestriction protein ArdC